MSDTKHTPWFPIQRESVPVRKGVYELAGGNREPWSYWNGRFFVGAWSTPSEAKRARNFFSIDTGSITRGSAGQHTNWRGLTRRAT